MNDNLYAAGSGGGIDLTFGGALNNLPEGVDKGKAFQLLVNDALANKRSEKDTAEFRGLLEYFGSPERQQRILDMTSDFQKKQIAEATNAKLLLGLPGQIAGTFARPAMIAAAGDIAAANKLMELGGDVGSMYAQGIRPMSISLPTPTQYFK